MNAKTMLGALLLASTFGCYSYRPVSTEDVRAGAQVRARITAEEATRLGSVVPMEGRLVAGEVLETGGDGLLLLVPVTTDVVGTRMETLSQRTRIPRSGIVEIELRQVDRLKTGIVIGGGVVLGAAIAAAALERGGRSDRPGPGEPPAELVVPLGFVLRLGR